MKDNEFRVEYSTYRGLRSVEMESAALRLIIVPELGGNISSLQFKSTGKEWLADATPGSTRKAGYGDEFLEPEMSGWDECFPTIVACPYPTDGQYKGRELPDHGEVWSIPWRFEIRGETLDCQVTGAALPYVLRREISFVDAQTLRFSYELLNRAEETLSVMWTAHPLFAVTGHTRIIVDSSLNRVLCVDGGKHLEVNQLYDWPTSRGKEQQRLIRDIDDLSLIGWAAARDSRKFYFKCEADNGWTILEDQKTGEFLKMNWSTGQLSYLGIWINQGQYNDQLVCAVEPGNGYYDSLDEAVGRGEFLEVAAGATSRWQFNLTAGSK